MAGENVITTQALIDKFKYALDNKWGYIWGASGGVWTQKQQDAATREQTVKWGQQWVGHHVADCSGLFSWAFKQLGGYMYHGSDTMFRKYTTARGTLKNGARTDGQGLIPGTAVFTWKAADGKYGHVGLYIGDGWVIEAHGTQKGVIRSKVTESRWTHWGELKGVDYSGTQPEPAPAPQPEPEELPPTIRKGNRNIYVNGMQTILDKLGYSLGICGIDGDFGTATEKAVKEFQRDHSLNADGICGPKTWAALLAAEKKPEEKQEEKPVLFTVMVPGLTDEQAEELCKQYPGAIKAVG